MTILNYFAKSKTIIRIFEERELPTSMKNIPFRFVLLGLIICLPFARVNSQAAISTPDSIGLYSYKWSLFKMQNVKLYDLDRSRFPYLFFTPGDTIKFKGQSGCKDIEGEYLSAPGNKITSLHIRQSTGECYKKDIDSKFMKRLWKVDHFKIKDHELKLYNGPMLVARFYAECTHDAYYSIPSLEGEWVINYFAPGDNVYIATVNHNFNHYFPHGAPTITFSFELPETVQVSVGCDSFSKQFMVEHSIFHFTSPHVSFDEQCNTEVIEIFQSTLSKVSQYGLGDNILYLLQGGKVVMGFERKNDVTLTDGPAWRFLEKRKRKVVYACGN